MLFRLLIVSLVLGIPPAYALDTENLSAATLQIYGKALSKTATTYQWQQLWKNTRDAGHFDRAGPQHRFTVPMSELPALLSTTLGEAHSTTTRKTTQALYRRDFAPRVVGVHDKTPMTAICLWVDWRSLPDYATPADGRAMYMVSLMLTRPC